MPKNSDLSSFNNVTCPFCSIHCDDLNIDVHDNKLEVKNDLLPDCKKRFEQFNYNKNSNVDPKIKGKTVRHEDSIKKCKELVKLSKEIIISNSSADVNVVRELLYSSSRMNAILDHVNSDIFLKNMSLFQRKGYISTTLSEIKNKSDVIILFSNNILANYPRIIDRVLAVKNSFSTSNAKKKIFIIGNRKNNIKHRVKDDRICYVDFNNKKIPELLESLKLNKNDINLKSSDFKILAPAVNKSKYLSIIWSTSEYIRYEFCQKIINSISQYVLDRNKSNRAACLALSGNEGDVSSSQTTGWFTGFPVRVKFTGKYFEYDRDVYRSQALIKSGDSDLVIHINSFSNKLIQINKKVKNIVIGHPLTKYNYEPDVFIPCGVPGIDYQGLIFRTDNVVTLPLSSIRIPIHKSVQEIIREINK